MGAVERSQPSGGRGVVLLVRFAAAAIVVVGAVWALAALGGWWMLALATAVLMATTSVVLGRGRARGRRQRRQGTGAPPSPGGAGAPRGGDGPMTTAAREPAPAREAPARPQGSAHPGRVLFRVPFHRAMCAEDAERLSGALDMALAPQHPAAEIVRGWRLEAILAARGVDASVRYPMPPKRAAVATDRRHRRRRRRRRRGAEAAAR